MSNSEKALQMHEQWNGKLETTAKAHVNSREDLAIAYTPGVAEPCKVIAKDPEAAYKYTCLLYTSSSEYTTPVGLFGVLTITAFVFAVIFSSNSASFG